MDTNIDVRLHEESGQRLLNYLEGEGKLKADPLFVKAAMSAYNGSTRAMSTLRVKDAMQLTILKDLAKNEDELRKYVKATMPDYVPDDL